MGRVRGHLRVLREALERLEEVACILSEATPGARLYLAGGAAEDRLTVLSDIDVVVVLGHEPGFEEAVRVREKIYRLMEERGLPLYLPLDLHIVGPAGLKRYKALRPLKCRGR